MPLNVQSALRLPEIREPQETDGLQWLQQAWNDGVDSGDYGPLNLDAIRVEGRKRLAAKPDHA